MNTPWGYADYVKNLDGSYNGESVVLDDLVTVSTPSHGGIGIKKGEAADAVLSNYAKCIAINEGSYYWFEEDCNWAIVILEFENKVPGCFDEKTLQHAVDTTERWHEAWHEDYVLGVDNSDR
jgi:hypothetical protein